MSQDALNSLPQHAYHPRKQVRPSCGAATAWTPVLLLLVDAAELAERRVLHPVSAEANGGFMCSSAMVVCAQAEVEVAARGSKLCSDHHRHHCRPSACSARSVSATWSRMTGPDVPDAPRRHSSSPHRTLHRPQQSFHWRRQLRRGAPGAPAAPAHRTTRRCRQPSGATAARRPPLSCATAPPLAVPAAAAAAAGSPAHHRFQGPLWAAAAADQALPKPDLWQRPTLSRRTKCAPAASVWSSSKRASR